MLNGKKIGMTGNHYPPSNITWSDWDADRKILTVRIPALSVEEGWEVRGFDWDILTRLTYLIWIGDRVYLCIVRQHKLPYSID
jgi:hypothetical protein